MDWLLWIALGLILISQAFFMFGFYRFRHRALWAEHQAETWKNLVDSRANIANTWIQACKLINIQRDERMNYFTFARGEKTFVIETMGLLGDDVVEWKQQAGLIDE